MTWEEHKAELLKRPEFKNEWDKLETEYQVARAVIKARIEKGVSQKNLADMINTKQSVISRLEGATRLPSLSFLKRIATALKTEISIVLKP